MIDRFVLNISRVGHDVLFQGLAVVLWLENHLDDSVATLQCCHCDSVVSSLMMLLCNLALLKQVGLISTTFGHLGIFWSAKR